MENLPFLIPSQTQEATFLRVRKMTNNEIEKAEAKEFILHWDKEVKGSLGFDPTKSPDFLFKKKRLNSFEKKVFNETYYCPKCKKRHYYEVPHDRSMRCFGKYLIWVNKEPLQMSSPDIGRVRQNKKNDKSQCVIC